MTYLSRIDHDWFFFSNPFIQLYNQLQYKYLQILQNISNLSPVQLHRDRGCRYLKFTKDWTTETGN